MASAHETRLWASATDTCYSARNVTHGAHPVGAGDVGSRVELDELGEMYARGKVCIHGINVGAKPITRELVNALSPRPQITHKVPRAVCIAVTNEMRNNKFGFAIQREPSPHAAPFFRSVRAQPFFVASNKSVQFVSLYQIRANRSHCCVKQSLSFVPSSNHQIEDCAAVQARQSGDGTYRRSFHHQFKNTRSRVQIGVVGVKPFDEGLRESSFAGLAAPTLDSALTEVTELFAVLVLAFQAGHIRLCFLADVAVEFAWVGIAGHSACRLALSLVAAGGGALLSRWGREGLNLQPTDSKSVALPELSYGPKGAFTGCCP